MRRAKKTQTKRQSTNRTKRSSSKRGSTVQPKPSSRRQPDDQEPSSSSPATRGLWSGSLTFGLVNVQVNLFPALRSSRAALRMLAPDGTPLARRYYCPRHEQFVSWEDIVRGYELEKDQFVVVSDDELESIEPRKTRSIELERFVEVSEIDPIYAQRPYILVPNESSWRAYQLLAESMEEAARAGIATFVMRGKEYLIAILSEGGLLRAETLRFADEVRSAKDVELPQTKEPPKKVLQKMRQEVEKLSKPSLAMSELQDEYSCDLKRLVDARRTDGVVEPDPEAAEDAGGGEVIDLFAALKESLERPASSKRPRGPSRRQSSSGAGKGAALDEQRKEDLYERAKRLGIEGRSSMSKKQLAAAIKRSG